MHVHSHYSLLDGLSKLDDLVKKAAELNFSALALTDHGVLYGVIEFYERAKKAGIKPIIGMEAYLAPRSRFDKTKIDAKSRHLTLLAENNVGYQNLIKLSSLAWLEGFYYKPRIDKELLQKYHEGIIALSGCLNGEIPKLLLEGNFKAAKEKVYEYQEIFGKDNFFLEIQNHPRLEDSRKVFPLLIELSQKTKVPLVATHDSHYLDKEDAPVHDVFLAIQTGKNIEEEDRLTMKYDDFSLKSAEEMAELFKDLPSALENTLLIAERCNVDLELGKYKFPHFEVPEGETKESYLRKLCFLGLKKKNLEKNEEAKKRMEYELKVIESMGFASYFLVVQDFVNWAKNNGISVGPGRGSAAGSLVAYLLGITEVNPLKYDLLFERFLNPQRVSMPDIDVDVADVKRDEVIEYLKRKYGENKVAQIITFGRMKARAAVRDAGRALGLPYSLCDKVAKFIPPGAPLEEVEDLLEIKKLIKEKEEVKILLETAKKLEGVVRHASVHASGVVITPGDLTEYLPLQFAPQDQSKIITQYEALGPGKEYGPIDDLGLLKIDILGLRTLSIIDETKKLVKERHQQEIVFDEELEDPKVYKFLHQGKTVGIFQLEGRGMTETLKRMKPENLEELSALIALYRPGPLELIPQYVRRKFGKEEIEYLHPKLEPILKNTFGIMIYQEQLMRVANEIAGFSLAEADNLRKAISKKNITLLEELKNKFIEGAIRNGTSKEVAEKLWQFIEPFGRYGFNKSHSVSYAILGYHTAFLKAYYPLEFLVACLIHEGSDIERVKVYIEDLKNLGVKVLPPDINESGFYFTLVNETTVRFGLGSIKNVGWPLIEAIEKERKNNGPFKSIADFLNRVKHKDLNKKSLESLIKAGVFDRFVSRSILIGNLEYLLEYLQKTKTLNLTQSLFGTSSTSQLNLKPVNQINELELLKWEKELLGIYLSGHPYQKFAPYLQNKTKTIKEISKMDPGMKVALGGVLNQIRRVLTKNKEPFASLEIEDLTGKIEVILFPRVYEQYFEILKEGRIYYLVGTLDLRGDQKIIRGDLIIDLTENNLKNKSQSLRTLKL